MVNASGCPNRLAFDLGSTLSTFLHVRHVVLFTEDLVSEGVVGASDHFLAHGAMLLGFLKVSFADWLVLKEVVRMPQRFIADVTLHTVWVIISVVVDDTVPDNLLTTDTALLLTSLETLGAVRLIILGVEFAIKLLSTAVATETFLVKDLSKCCATLFGQIPLAVVTLL